MITGPNSEARRRGDDPLGCFPSRPFFKDRVGLLLLFATIFFVYLQLFRPWFTPFFHEADHLIFLYDAERMLRGEVIYRDFFQFTFPGTQLVYLSLMAVFGTKYWVYCLVVMVNSSVLFLLCLSISKKVLPGHWAYLPAVLFVFFGLRWFGLDGTHRMLSPIFILLAICFLLKSVTVRSSLIAGSLCALTSFFTQPRGVLGIAACIIFILIDGIGTKASWRRTFANSAGVVIGFALAIFVLCAYFVYAAGFDNFVASTIVHPARYYGLHPDNTYGVYFVELRKAMDLSGAGRSMAAVAAIFHGLLLPLSVLAFFIYFFVRRGLRNWQHWRSATLLAITAFVFYAGTSAPMHLRFFSISIPALILLIWMLREYAAEKTNWRLLSALISGGFIATGFAQVIVLQLRSDVSVFELPAGTVAVIQPNPQFERYVWLRDHTDPGDFVYEVYEPFVNFPLLVRNPTRIGQVFQYPYTPREHVEEAVIDLKKNQPRYIVWDNAYNVPREKRRPDDPTEPMAEYVLSNYMPLGRVFMIADEPVQIWVRKSNFQ